MCFFRLWHWNGRVNFSPRKTILWTWYTDMLSPYSRGQQFVAPHEVSSTQSTTRTTLCFFAELSRVNAMNPAKHTRIAMKIWTYTSENGKKNCMGRDWIFAEKQIIITRLLARIFWENSHQKSLFILERLNLHSTRPLENPENLLDSFITILNTPFFYKMGRT